MKKFVFILVTILFSLTATSQVDSLLQLCEKATEKQKSGLYLEVSLQLRADSAKSNAYSRMAYQLAVKNNQITEQAKALYYLGETSFNSSDYHDAITDFKKALSTYIKVKDTVNVVNCYKSIGLSYYYIDEGEKAITQFIEGMKWCENDKKNTAKFLSNIAIAHTRMRNMNNALYNYRKALSLNASINNFSGMAVNYNGLGEIYKITNRPDSALKYYYKANNLFKEIGSKDKQAITLSNIAGIILNYPDSMKKSIDCLNQSWTIFRKLGWRQYEAEFKQGIGIILYKQGKFKQAIDALKNSIELNDKFNRGFKIKTTSYSLLSKVYEKIGDYQTALKYNKLFIQYSDSLEQKEKYDRIANLEKQYETEKKENQIVRLQARQELTLSQLQKNKQLKLLGMATAFLLLLLVFFISLKYFDKLKSNQLLREKNQLIALSEQELRLLNASKNKFFSIIAHDLKNPLHAVLGYSSLLSKNYDLYTENERRKFAGDIHQSTNNIFRLLQNLLEWSKSQTGRLEFAPFEIEFRRILENSVSVLHTLAEQKKIQLTFNSSNDLKVFADPIMIETVLRNLINNAIKFTPENGQIEITTEETEYQAVIKVNDTGVGISEEDIPNLFRIDSKVKRRGTNNEDGSGLGLILCREFVDKHNGAIWVESTPGKGSSFSFTIPVQAATRA